MDTRGEGADAGFTFLQEQTTKRKEEKSAEGKYLARCEDEKKKQDRG